MGIDPGTSLSFEARPSPGPPETHGGPTTTTSDLIRWAGLRALVAGLGSVLVGVFHPPNGAASVTSTRWATVHLVACAMCFVGLLLAIGTALAPVAGLLPNASQPKVAIPVGLALAWLGYALWTEPQPRPSAPRQPKDGQ